MSCHKCRGSSALWNTDDDDAHSMKWTWLMWCQWDVQTQGKNLWYCNECMAFNQPLCICSIQVLHHHRSFSFLDFRFGCYSLRFWHSNKVKSLRNFLMISFHYPIRRVTAGQFSMPFPATAWFLYSECILMQKKSIFITACKIISSHRKRETVYFTIIWLLLPCWNREEWRNTHSFSPRQHRSLTPSHTHMHTRVGCDVMTTLAGVPPTLFYVTTAERKS